MYHGWNGGSWAGAGYGFPWGSLVMGVFMLALLALVVLAFLRLAKANKTDRLSPRERGIDILIERFSRGEIDAETFRAMKAELESKT